MVEESKFKIKELEEDIGPIKFEFNNELYEITIKGIGDMIDEPDGSGIVPVDFSIIPDTESQEVIDSVGRFLESLLLSALTSLIESHHEKD